MHTYQIPNRHKICKHGASHALLPFLLFIFILGLITSCSTKEDTTHNHELEETYTCPMHPNVVSDKPGSCPICGMDLVKVNKLSGNTNDLMLSESQMKLANIRTEIVKVKPVGQTTSINGRLAADEQKTQFISSRAPGRIEKLFIKETGQAVRKGQPLYTLYSELLLTLQQEYLLAKEQYETLGNAEPRYKSFLEAAERKLLLYGFRKEQIGELKDRSSIRQQVTLLAPESGMVTEIKVAEGQYIAEGSELYKLEDLSTLWVEAELYPSETSLVKVGDKISVRISGNERTPYEATVTFLSPEYRSNTQIVLMRASLKNVDQQLKPGQAVQVMLAHSQKEAVAVPVDAVIRDAKGSHVYVQAGNLTFRPQMVKTGTENFDQIEITEGLNANDTVVVSGAYLLYSEIILKKGSDPMQGHNH